MNTTQEPIEARFASLIAFFRQMIWKHGSRNGFCFGAAIFIRLARTVVRFNALHNRLQADPSRAQPTPPEWAPRKPGAALIPAPSPIPAPPVLSSSVPHAIDRSKIPLPRGIGWLRRHIPTIHIVGGYVQALLHDPAYREILASDYRYARLLRPLCHMLGMCSAELPDFMKRARRKRAYTPKPKKTADDPYIPRAWLPPKRLRNRAIWEPRPIAPQSHDPPFDIQQYWRSVGYK